MTISTSNSSTPTNFQNFQNEQNCSKPKVKKINPGMHFPSQFLGNDAVSKQSHYIYKCFVDTLKARFLMTASSSFELIKYFSKIIKYSREKDGLNTLVIRRLFLKIFDSTHDLYKVLNEILLRIDRTNSLPNKRIIRSPTPSIPCDYNEIAKKLSESSSLMPEPYSRPPLKNQNIVSNSNLRMIYENFPLVEVQKFNLHQIEVDRIFEILESSILQSVMRNSGVLFIDFMKLKSEFRKAFKQELFSYPELTNFLVSSIDTKLLLLKT